MPNDSGTKSQSDGQQLRNPYDRRQIKLLQDRARAAHESLNRRKKHSWRDMERDIVDTFKELSAEERAKLPAGYQGVLTVTFWDPEDSSKPQDESSQKSKNSRQARGTNDRLYNFANRKTNTMDPPTRLVALAVYLTDPENHEYSELSKEDLYPPDEKPSAWEGRNSERMLALQRGLVQFLQHGTPDEPSLSAHLSREYLSLSAPEHGLPSFRLVLEKSDAINHVFWAALSVATPLPRRGSSVPIENQTGWLVVFPEDKLVMLLKATADAWNPGENFLYVSSAIDEEIYEKDTEHSDPYVAKLLAFRRYGLPTTIGIEDYFASQQKLLELYHRDNESNLLIFRA